jgi:hypothetical protein
MLAAAIEKPDAMAYRDPEAQYAFGKKQAMQYIAQILLAAKTPLTINAIHNALYGLFRMCCDKECCVPFPDNCLAVHGGFRLKHTGIFIDEKSSDSPYWNKLFVRDGNTLALKADLPTKEQGMTNDFTREIIGHIVPKHIAGKSDDEIAIFMQSLPEWQAAPPKPCRMPLELMLESLKKTPEEINEAILDMEETIESEDGPCYTKADP